jgi:hypothetical protein
MSAQVQQTILIYTLIVESCVIVLSYLIGTIGAWIRLRAFPFVLPAMVFPAAIILLIWPPKVISELSSSTAPLVMINTAWEHSYIGEWVVALVLLPLAVAYSIWFCCNAVKGKSDPLSKSLGASENLA